MPHDIATSKDFADFNDYQHCGVGLLRATAELIEVRRWPEPDNPADCMAWLADTWQMPGIAPAIRHASPVLASRVTTILARTDAPDRDAQRAAMAVVRYVLRAQGRPTPFGTFAGVSPLSVGASTKVQWHGAHRPEVRAETRWLHQILTQLEACPQLLSRLEVMVNDTGRLHAGRWELPGQTKVSVRVTPAVALVRDEAAIPVGFGVLADKLAHTFPGSTTPGAMLTLLLRHGLLLSTLRAPSTVTDPLGFVVDRLHEAGAAALPVAPLLAELETIHRAIGAHNHNPSERARASVADRMRTLADSVRVPLALDLRLDAHVQLPQVVAHEMQRAAGVLARLVRQTTGSRAWRDYFTAFVDRYGTGTLVRLRDLVDPDAGLGLPRGYPGSAPATRRHVLSDRDEHLLALAARASALGQQEITLEDTAIERLAAAGGGHDALPLAIPPHLDLGARIHATSPAALDRGEFTLTVSPGRAAGTLTSRFTTLVPESGLERVFATVPTTTVGAVPVQLSFAPIFPTAENVCRVPASLDLISLGEHTTGGSIPVDDLAVTANHRRLHLVDLASRRVLEPQVLHALAPKQQPPLARLLGELSRALAPGWIGFDWGAADTLPFLPRLRHRRTILSVARWRLSLSDLPELSGDRAHRDRAGWDRALEIWRASWRCPNQVELRDFDQHLPLDLTVPAHREILYRHLRQHTEAVLSETVDPGADSWLGGHPHTVVLPLVSRRPPEPAVPVSDLPVLTSDHVQLPGAAGSSWLYVKLFFPTQRIDHFLVHALPALLNTLDGRPWWFVRYPQARDIDEPDHLRLRVRVHGDRPGDTEQALAAVTAWTDRLRTDGLIGRLAVDTYFPEIGRYQAMSEAENVFAADSVLVLAHLTRLNHRPAPTVLTGLSLFDMATGFLGDRRVAADWLSTRTRHAVADRPVPERADVTAITRLARSDRQTCARGWSAVADAYALREAALARYRAALPTSMDSDALDQVLRSLLHMHHNRALGVDRDREAVCLRLARHAAAAWRASQEPA